MNPQFSSSLKPRSIKTRFAFRFLRALQKINSKRPTSSCSSSSSREISRRFQRVKLAADASMASAVGSRRVWSRAVLIKLRNRSHARVHALIGLRRQSERHHHRTVTERKRVNMKKRKFHKIHREVRADELRRLVPGGEAMDMCSLLDETAHYIKCLTAQVKVMRSIVDYCST